MDSLLAHLINRFSGHAEDLATESLAFLLERYETAASAFERFLNQISNDLPDDLRYVTQNWDADQARPDLVGITATGTIPLILEAKFWAGLTANQPVTYLRQLVAGSPGLLIFVAPTQRQQFLRDTLLQRCNEAGLALSIGQESGAAVARLGGQEEHVLAVTSWRDVLKALRSAMELSHDYEALADLRQLEGLCDREDEEAFLPLTSEELSGGIGRRLRQLESLIIDVAKELRATGDADLSGLTRSAGVGYFGRYLKLAGWECLLHVNFRRWGSHRATPLWLQVTDKRWPSSTVLLTALNPLRHTSPSRLLVGDGQLVVPVLLPVNADRDQAQLAAVEQLTELSRLMRLAPPDTSN